MKCTNCKQKLKKDSAICPNCSFDNAFYIQDAKDHPRFSPLKKGLIGLLVVAVLCVGGGVALYLNNITPAKITVAAAFSSTASQLSQETAQMQRELPLLTHLDQVTEGQSTLTLSSTLSDFSGTAQLSLDMIESQYLLENLYLNNTDYAVTAHLSPDALIVNLEDSGNVLGFSLVTLAEDIQSSAFAYLFDVDAIAQSYRQDILENIPNLDEEFISILQSALTQLTMEWEVDALGEETIIVDGTTLDTTAYTLMIDPEILRSAVYGVVIDCFDSPVYAPYLALLANQMDMTPLGLEAAALELVNQLLDELIQMDDCTFTVNLYQGRVVLLSALRGAEGYAVSLNPIGNLLDGIAFSSRYGDRISPYFTLSATLNNGAFTGTLDVLGAPLTLHYFTEDSSDNLILNWSENTPFTATVDATTPDALTLILPVMDGYLTLESQLTTLEDQWFTPPTSYTNLLTMSQTDLMLLAMALTF